MIAEELVEFIIFFFLIGGAVKLLTLMNDVECGVISILDEKVQYSAKKRPKNNIMTEPKYSFNVHFNESSLKEIIFFERV